MNDNILEMAEKIITHYNISDAKNCTRIDNGFNRAVFDIDDKYILKICINREKESGMKNELEFFKNNTDSYASKLYESDISMQLIPYMFSIENKIHGTTLSGVWHGLSAEEKRNKMFELVEILKKVHKKYEKEYDKLQIAKDFEMYLKRCYDKKLLTDKEKSYLEKVRIAMESYFSDISICYVHGDIHFNNILLTDSGMKLIDYECYGPAPVDKEFDSINRMARNPRSFIPEGNNLIVYEEDYKNVMQDLKDFYKEVCGKDTYDSRLLIYDCLNAMKWMYVFPEHKPYHDTLFEKSKRLIIR